MRCRCSAEVAFSELFGSPVDVTLDLSRLSGILAEHAKVIL